MAKLSAHGTVILTFVHESISETNCKVKVTDQFMSDRTILTKTNYYPVDGQPFGGNYTCKKNRIGTNTKIPVKVTNEEIIAAYIKGGYTQVKEKNK